MLWYYDRKADTYEQRTPRGLAHARHLYTFDGANQEERYALEKAFSVLEDKASPVFQRLREEVDITQNERNTIAEFAGMQYLRTPIKLDLIGSLVERGSGIAMQQLMDGISAMSETEFETYINKYGKETGQDVSALTRKSLLKFQQRHPFMRATKDGRLQTLIKSGTDLAINFSAREWVILHAQNDSRYITSDTAMFLSPDGHTSKETGWGPGSPGMAVFFPFAQDASLMITSKQQPTILHALINNSGVKRVNDGLASKSNQLYSHSDRLLRSIVKRGKLAKTEFKSIFSEEQLQEIAKRHFGKSH